jgi:hypothetical protein
MGNRKSHKDRGLRMGTCFSPAPPGRVLCGSALVEDEANVGVLEEKRFGSREETQNFICVVRRDDTKSGIILNGEFHAGYQYATRKFEYTSISLFPAFPLPVEEGALRSMPRHRRCSLLLIPYFQGRGRKPHRSGNIALSRANHGAKSVFRQG